MSFYGDRQYKEIRISVVKTMLEEYPDLPNRTIARMLFAQYPELFPTIERARRVIRYYRGVSGKHNLRCLKDRKYVRKNL